MENTNALRNKCYDTFCKKYHIPQQEKLYKNLTKKLSGKSKSLNSKTRKSIEKGCYRGYCNPGCSGTIFQAGKKMPTIETDNSLTKKLGFKAKKNFAALQKILRNEIFKGKTNVLKNSFYEKLSPKTRKVLKKKGALSGCTMYNKA